MASTTTLNSVGDRGVSLGYAVVPFEQKSKVSAVPGHHGQVVTVRPKESDRPGSDPISCKDMKASVRIQGIMCLLGVQENLEEDRLPNVPKLLEKICHEGSGPRPPARPLPVQHIVKLDVCHESEVQEAGNCLPQYLHQPDPPEVSD